MLLTFKPYYAKLLFVNDKVLLLNDFCNLKSDQKVRFKQASYRVSAFLHKQI